MFGYRTVQRFFRSIVKTGQSSTALIVIAVDQDQGQSIEASVNNTNSYAKGKDSPHVLRFFEDYDSEVPSTRAIRVSKKYLAQTLFNNSEVVYWKPEHDRSVATYEDTEFTFDTGTQDATAQVTDVKFWIKGQGWVAETGSDEAQNDSNSFTYAINGTQIVFTLQNPAAIQGSPTWVHGEWSVKITEVDAN